MAKVNQAKSRIPTDLKDDGSITTGDTFDYGTKHNYDGSVA